ncbi:MAG: hypothetical protein Rubg2KO_27550 [Rubricoccaceae bacterium]
MIESLEVRWFLPGPIPDPVQAWFEGLGLQVALEARTDRYLIPTESDDLGLKVREGRVEAKQRAGQGERGRWGSAEAAPASWRKWSLGLATDAPLAPGWADVAKARRQRWVQGEGAACALELAEVSLEGAVWWSICLEASGGERMARQRVFEDAAGRWLDRSDAPSLSPAAACGYPAWLRREAG